MCLRRIRFVVILTLGLSANVLLLNACTKHINLAYNPSVGLSRATTSRQITVFKFADRRKYADPFEVGGRFLRVNVLLGFTYNPVWWELEKFVSDTEIAVVVARSLATALKARGHNIVIEDQEYSTATAITTPRALSGDLIRFNLESKGIQRVVAEAVVRCHDAQGRVLRSSLFIAIEPPASREDTVEAGLNRALAAIVEKIAVSAESIGTRAEAAASVSGMKTTAQWAYPTTLNGPPCP